MGKKYILEKFSPNFSVKQLFRIKRLTTLVLFLGVWLICTNSVYADNSGVDLKGNTVKITNLINSNNLLPAPVTGVVTDSKGTTLPGVTVRVRGTNKATITNAEGKFTIDVTNNQSVLVFSCMGYRSETIVVGTQKTLTVAMLDEVKALDEVVVVGYGTQKRGSITGAVSSVKSDELVKSSSVAATSALVGKVAGITARSYDSRPGNGTSIQIRNMGNPLYVIDGVPYSTNDGTSSFGFNTDISGQSVFNQLGLEDIESVSILKDASASVYGLRASNGVVLVTTKKGGRTEQPSINVNGYYGVQNFTRYYDVANAGQYVTALVQSNQNRGQTPAYTKEEVAKWVAGTEPGYQNNDYKKIMLRPNVPQSYISVNATGGSARTNYYFSVSNLNQDAVLKDFTFNRTNIQSNISTKLAKGLTIGTQISGRIEKRHNVGVPGLDDYFNPLLSISSMWPTETMYANNNPLYINQTHNVNVNPATYTDQITGWCDDVTRALNVNLNAQYDFNFGLTAKGIYSYNFTNEDFNGFEYIWPAYIYNAATDTYADRPIGGAPYGNQNPWREIHKNNIVSRFAQFQLNYTKQLGNHNISAVAAYERSDMENYYVAVHTIPPTNYIPTMLFANQDYLGYSWVTEARAGYTGRANYSYKQKYLLEVLGRYDGSYLYRSDKRWGFFPGASIGWRMSEEPFFKNLVGNAVSNLKLRASYGVTGSESGLNAFDYLPGYNYPSGSAVFDGTYVIGLQPKGTLPVTNLTWVKNQSANIGIDFTVMGDKLTGQFDVFNRKKTGMPAARYDVLLPSEVGYSLPNENLNSEATRGIEGQLTYSNKSGVVDYTIGVNATLARRRDLTQYKPRFGNSWDRYRSAYVDRWGSIDWGYQVIGQFQTQAQIDAYTINNDGKNNTTELPGDYIFKDQNGDGVINTLDNRPIGYAEGAQPYMSFGLAGSLTYKGITLSFSFAGATMQSFRRNVELKVPFQNNGNSADYMLADVWHHADPYDITSPWIPGTYPALRKDVSTVNTSTSDIWITNINYFRLKNLEIGYNIPQKLLKKAGISKLRVYANGSNLFSFDNMKKIGIDPEIASQGGLIYPQQSLINIGFNLSL